jgi:hypothetical protein
MNRVLKPPGARSGGHRGNHPRVRHAGFSFDYREDALFLISLSTTFGYTSRCWASGRRKERKQAKGKKSHLFLAPILQIGTWASADLAAAIRKLASVALKARRQNELSLIRTSMVRSGKATQRFISRTVKPYRAPREHYVFIADCIHRYFSFSLSRHSWPGFIHLRIPEHFSTARKFAPAPFAALPSSHLDGLQNIPVSVLS